MSISTTIVAELEQELAYKTAEKEQLRDQLSLYDVRIDNYDAIIENMDRSILPLIDEINVAISSVKSAYDARIAAGCKSDLVWTQTSSRSFRVGIAGSSITQITYTVTKNPDVRIDYGYWGAKYYRRPRNQDYGANIVKDFIGTIGVGNTNLAVVTIGGTFRIEINDTITDSLTSPSVFAIDNLPEVVSFGTSSIVINQVDFGGSIAFGSTIIAHVGVGTTVGINTGDVIVNVSALPYGTTVVGFGTTSYQVEVWEESSGSYISSSTIANSLIVSSAGIGSTTTTFQIGITSEFPSLFLSTSSVAIGSSTVFTVIRNTQSVLDEFDFTNNPIDPVTIGIMNNSTAGYGHTLVRVNNLSSPGPHQWREVLGPEFGPEPACGNNFARYYSGNLQWPGFITYTMNSSGVAIASTFSYANEGTSVVVTIGGTISSRVATAYTGTSSINPSAGVCSPLDSAITAAEASRDAIIARNQPIIDSTINASSELRRLRDRLESVAFTILQGRAAADAELVRLTNSITNIRSLDLRQYEPENYRSANRFSSSTVGIAST